MFTERYFINEEKRTVVCKLEGCCNAVVEDMERKGYPFCPEFIIDDSFVGKAVCSEDDVFNEEIGRKVAYNRAIAKVNKAKKKALINFVTDFTNWTTEVVANTLKLVSKYETIVRRKEHNVSKILNDLNK